MKRSAIRAGLVATMQIVCGATLFGGVNQWTRNSPAIPFYQVAIDPADARTVYALGGRFYSFQGEHELLYKSIDGGETWEPRALGRFPFLPADHVSCLAVDPTRPKALYAGTLSGQFLRSHDGGTQWDSVWIPGFLPPAIAIDDATGTIYLGNRVVDIARPVIKSADGGTTWHETTLSKPHTVYSLLADSLDRTVLAGTDWAYSGSYYDGINASGGAVARTTDGGDTWSRSTTDLGSSVQALAMVPPEPWDYGFATFFAGTANGDVYRSVDGGDNWDLLWSFSPSGSSGSVQALVADPATGVLYAATSQGVFSSADAAATWTPFNRGMGPQFVNSLAIDPSGRFLHAATNGGLFDLELRRSAPSAPCVPESAHLCLLGSRFRVDLAALDPRRQAVISAHAVTGWDRAGYFSFPDLTGDPTLPEVLVKMIDATSLPGGNFWVFFGSMTSAPYTLVVTDTKTGAVREYDGTSLCGGSAFFPELSVGGQQQTAPPVGARAPLESESATDLVLLSGRFRVSLSARDPVSNAEAFGQAIAIGDRFGSFGLPAFTGDPQLPEVFVKMIDATGGAFLFFYTGLTSLPYSLTVVDTVSGAQRKFAHDPEGSQRLCGGADMLVFSP